MAQEESNIPVITLKRDRFCSFIGRTLDVEEMAKWLPWLGVDLEEIGSNYVKIEYNPNRVDLSSHAGVARAFSGLMGWSMGLTEYKVEKGAIVLHVDPTVSEVRPYVLAGVIRDIRLDEDAVRELVDMQEDIHWGMGRNRRKISIGVHNLQEVKPPFRYTTSDPKVARFVPLGETKEMNLKEILERHEKGIKYRHIVDWAPRYPLIIDSEGNILSFPPVINSELTRIDNQTRKLFIDITGIDYNSLARGLNVLVTALADMGGVIESVQVKYRDKSILSPNLAPQHMRLRVDYASRLLGLKLSETRIIKCLRKARLGARRRHNGIVEVLIPPYRIDIMHEIDLVEEAAIGYGYFRLKPSMPATITTGEQHRTSELANFVRQIMIGLKFIEVVNFILVNEHIHYEKMRKKSGKAIKLANPVSTEHSIAREELLPSLMRNLMDNKHESYPQRIFEVSDVIKISEKAETHCKRQLHVSGVSSHATANFTETKAYVEALLANLGIAHSRLKEIRDPRFIRGRAAAVYISRRRIGVFGEVHPEIIINFELENPVGAFEIDLEGISKGKFKSQ